MSVIINLYAGPGTGKSTSAAYLYYLLKKMGKNAELVREYVKDWAWEERKIGPFDQPYFTGKQLRRESLLYGRADYIVTDSPVLLSVYYAQKFCKTHMANGVKATAQGFYQEARERGHKHYHIFLKRSKPYNPKGRYQSLEEAKEMDQEIKALLDELQIPYWEFNTEEDELAELLNTILSYSKDGK